MLVEDPRETLKAVCSMGDSIFTEATFKTAYEKEIKRIENPIDRKTTDTHFYTPKIYGLYASGGGRGTYRLSRRGKKLCEFLGNPKRQAKYRMLLADILLNNKHKGELFQQFIRFVAHMKTMKDISDRFGAIPARTLVAWAKEADIIDVAGDNVIAVKHKERKPAAKAFRRSLVKAYEELKKTEVFGISRIYVPIGEIRLLVCSELGTTKDEFTRQLTSLLSSSFGRKISLYGATTDSFVEEESFEFKRDGKLYLYLQIKQ